MLSALCLSGCGSPSASGFRPSSDCTISTTNLDYAGCNFAGRDLAGIDFQGDDLRRANLRGASLDGANLQGARVAGADVVGVRTDSSTICVNAKLGPCAVPTMRGGRHSS